MVLYKCPRCNYSTKLKPNIKTHLKRKFPCKPIFVDIADDFNIDKNKIAIWGEGAGALMAAGVAMKLAENNEADLVKVVIVDLPMLYTGWLEQDPAKLNEV